MKKLFCFAGTLAAVFAVFLLFPSTLNAEGIAGDSLDVIFGINTCPGEDCSTQMNVSFAAIKSVTECKIFLIKQSGRKKPVASGYLLKPSDQTLCTVFDSIYSKRANRENFYEDAVFHKFNCSFTSLDPDSRYAYWIEAKYLDDNGVLRTEETGAYEFRTAGARKWSACIISDFHSYPPLPGRLSSAMAMLKTVDQVSLEDNKRPIDWVLHLGDVCAWGGSWSFWKEMYAQPAFHTYMWAGLNGNHDNMTRMNAQSNQFFRHATSNPLNGYEGEEGVCYHFTYGEVLFVMLNSESMRDSTGLARAQQWVREVLGSSKARFKVVCEHYQWFHGTHGKTSQYARWKDLFDECGVDLALGANNHIYVRTHKLYGGKVVDSGPGTVYLQTPSSDNERGMDPYGELKYNQDIIAQRWNEGPKTVGAVLLDVDKRSMTLTLLDRYGNLKDELIIRK